MTPLWRAIYRVYRIISWQRYWLTRRFTRAGVAVLAGIIGATAIGLDTENTVAYQAIILLFLVMFISIAFTPFFRARFSAVRHLPHFGTAGHPVIYRVVLKNLTSKVQSGLTLLEDTADPRPSFAEWKATQIADQKLVRSFRFGQGRTNNPFRVAKLKMAPVPPMPPRHEAEAQIELTPLRRGLLRFKGVTLARPDPLGLFRSLVHTPLPQTMLVLPKRYPVPHLALPGTLKFQEQGVAMASNVGQSDEFVGLREYRRGDPLRHIHWRSWARTGRPIVKEFEDQFFVRHALVLDTFTEQPHSDVFEEAVSVAASFACTIPSQESLLDLLFIGSQAYCFTAGRGLAHADQMLEILASVHACTDKPFGTLEHLVLNHVAAVSGCVCVFLDWDDERREFVKKIRMLGLPVLVLVIVPAGHREKLEPGPMADDPGSLRALEVGRIEQDLARL